MAHVKGNNVNLLLKQGNTYSVIAGSESCDFNITANTVEAASKTDAGDGIFSHPEFNTYDWTASNESFLVDYELLSNLLTTVISGNATFDISYDIVIGSLTYNMVGRCIVTNLEVTANNGEFVKVRLSMTGNGLLTLGSQTHSIAKSYAKKFKGKALMLAIRTDADTWKTVACATGHTLSVNVQTEEVSDKDRNDSVVLKDVVGKSVKLTTSNLLPNLSLDAISGLSFGDIVSKMTSGQAVNIRFGYYPSSIGNEVEGEDVTNGWGAPEVALVEGTFLITSISQNGTVKQNATFNAEFSNVGEVTVD